MSENTALAVPPQPGELMMRQAEVMAKALFDFLPNGKSLPTPTRMALAMLAVQNGLDPFLGEVYAIPIKRENEETHRWETSYVLGIGRGGWLRNAMRTGLYKGHDMRFPSEEESKALRLGEGDIAQVCSVLVAESIAPRSPQHRVFGYGVVKGTDKTMMNRFTCSRKRAFVDALRMAFPMARSRSAGEQMQICVVDEETGEVLGNGHEPGKESEPLTIAAAVPEGHAQAEFTEAASDTSAIPYQPEGMPVVSTAPPAQAAPPPPQSPMAKAMNRGELMTNLNNLAREWYGGASGIALTNHLKKTFNKVAMGDLTMDELADQVGVFQKRVAERKAAIDAQPQLVGVAA